MKPCERLRGRNLSTKPKNEKEVRIMESILTKNQKKVYGWKVYQEDGQTYRIKATVRYDDECGNGHNSFSITGKTERKGGNGRWYEDSIGCVHDKIKEHFPELAPFIKWHLFDSTGPMHYIANTVYHAGNRDCWGKLKGEVKSYALSIKFGDFPITFSHKEKFLLWLEKEAPKFDFEVLAIEHVNRAGDSYRFGPKYTFGGFADVWHDCPFDSEPEALQFLEALKKYPVQFVRVPDSWGEGKERDLDAARSCAVWPEATDEELCAPDLKERLIARQEALVSDFRKDVESLGLVF